MKFFKQVLMAGSVTVLFQATANQGLPNNYNSLTACEKQALLWKNAVSTKHIELPELSGFGFGELLKLGVQHMTKKVDTYEDIAPKKWEKYLHARGVLAKVKLVPTKENLYSGVFEGADCALLRLSLTFKPGEDRNFAPGLALKVLRDKVPSANVSALYRLEGQDKDHNFLANPLSNIVPVGQEGGMKVVHTIFRRVSNYPEELMVMDLAIKNAKGIRPKIVNSPRQLFFVPNDSIEFSSAEHDFRTDLMGLPAGTELYQILAAPSGKTSFNYMIDYKNDDIEKFKKESIHIGNIVTTSEFLASEFGDSGIFFRHQVREKKK